MKPESKVTSRAARHGNRGAGSDATYALRCLECHHVGNRTFARAGDGLMRDVLGGEWGVRPHDCSCSCGSERLLLVRREAPDV